ncbi:Small-conductance mechanosensitive channel [Thalassovita gelatinovora]|uniref:Small-conductance mechanosensitive channel n=1 Tax=Thalassovita gelatinovora TaxID=53501 RepID=A0A0P1F6I0_THAGE|nr:mechanosensitive ion channel family protein [Thalassovita gelatinovora]QIZ79150.1 mechanosensitive ion channel [Thalassovita gelatinovora]CUH63596.1 Small-conductance mechanosensitive channel [Thalassovita gelatinovora]SER00291.1 Small-conductance mechanosensitive channel [Thalassovita gelatinovora]
MRFLILIFALCLTSPAWSQSAAPNGAEQPSGPISVEDSATTDAAIAVRIRDILSELEGYDDVTVTVTSGIVTLKGTTLDLAHAEALNDLITRVNGVVAIRNEVAETTDVVERLNPAVDRFTKRTAQFVAYLPLLAVALIAFGLIFAFGLVLARMKQPWNRLAPNSFIADIYRVIVRLGFLIAGLVMALDILGATALLSTILGAAGIVGLAIGFAVKDTVENFIASIMLSIRQPFRPNDAIEINGDEGKVIRLTSRATILLSWDGNHIRIPNSTVFKSRIVNYSSNAERRYTFDLAVAPESDLALALRLGEQTLAKLPFSVASPAPSVWIHEVGDSTITLRLAGWIDQTKTGLLAARSEAIRILMATFTGAGIKMPEPTYRLITQDTSAGKPSVAPAQTPRALDVEAREEQALEQIVKEERETKSNDDLLQKSAPTE